MKINNQLGNSIVEVLVAISVALIALTACTGYVLQIKNKSQRLLSLRSQSTQTQKIVQLILSDPKLFKVNFDPSEAAKCAALGDLDLPLVWDNTNTYAAADCPGCKGRLGYVIQPFPLLSIRGVYLVTIRMSHPVLTAQSSTVCNSVTIPGSKDLQMIVSLR